MAHFPASYRLTMAEAIGLVLELESADDSALKQLRKDLRADDARTVAKATVRLARFARWVRYVLVDNKLADDMPALARGEVRLFTATDVAMVRLARRLRTQEIASSWTIRVCLNYRREELVQAFRSGAKVALVVNGVVGDLTDAPKPSDERQTVWLPEIWHGIPEGIARLRHEHQFVTQYKQAVPIAALLRERRARVHA